jgi:lipopolysaccharide/colanic/teichoic acid biosynthesis glycosyltransferase
MIVGSYVLISLAASLIAFQVFRISSTIPRYISVGDLLDLAKAVVAGELMTAIVLFTVTRLDGIPRSVPAIHALILTAGLLAARGLINLADRNRRRAEPPRSAAAENVIVIGLNDWSVLLVKLMQAQAPERPRVIGLLDEEPRSFGRSVHGVQIFGPPAHLDALVEEFAAHGVRTDRVVVGAEAGELSREALAEVKRVCTRRNLELAFVPHLFGLGSEERAGRSIRPYPDRLPGRPFTLGLQPSPYFRAKRVIDAVAALILILWLLPLLLLAAFVVFLDVGSPVLFWQQRAGQGGRELQFYKLRTLHPPFDRRGQRIPEERRLSWIGRLLRRTRIDELPQVLNVLVGDMSLIGPRPLLPRDQPPSSALRLTVRPGITGWAQVNGGTSLSPTEKEALDIWYIRNASWRVDLRIIGMTVLTLLRGERRSEKALAQALSLQTLEARRNEWRLRQAASPRFGATAKSTPDDAAKAPVIGSR